VKFNFFVNFFQPLSLREDQEQIKEKKSILPPQVLLLAIGMFAFFIGIGIGSGYKRGQLLDSNTLELRDTIIFAAGGEQQVKIWGKNSNYVFYYEAQAEAVAVAPITGNVRKIVKGKKK